MRCFVAKDSLPEETRTAVTPDSVRKLVALGLGVEVQPGLGLPSGHTDAAYTAAGASLAPDVTTARSQADLLLGVNAPTLEQIAQVKPRSVWISQLDPHREPELLRALAERGVSALALELIPRSTLAQKMDVVSSQANLAGYVGVLLAATASPSIFPMMTTPAGTLAPARVLVVGAGVAGLQAIATARRLGARVEAFDTRAAVEEQIRSLGAKFVKIDLGATSATKDGYATALSAEQLELQRQGLAKVCAQVDAIVTTAKVFGKDAPRIITDDMVAQMRPGSVIVDLAADRGGNVSVTEPGKTIRTASGVTVIGELFVERRVAAAASQMFASNVASFLEVFIKAGVCTLDVGSEIVERCLVTHEGTQRFVAGASPAAPANAAATSASSVTATAASDLGPVTSGA
jgi:NAD(P) transhydrogenase subunit alpha